jgi:hypothetical protein
MESGKTLLSELTSLLIAGEFFVSPKLSRFCSQENCEEVSTVARTNCANIPDRSSLFMASPPGGS